MGLHPELHLKMEDEQRRLPNSMSSAKTDFTDITICGIPIPQATSTVEKKSTYV